MFLLNRIESELVEKLDWRREQDGKPDEYFRPRVTVVRRDDEDVLPPAAPTSKNAETSTKLVKSSATTVLRQKRRT